MVYILVTIFIYCFHIYDTESTYDMYDTAVQPARCFFLPHQFFRLKSCAPFFALTKHVNAVHWAEVTLNSVLEENAIDFTWEFCSREFLLNIYLAVYTTTRVCLYHPATRMWLYPKPRVLDTATRLMTAQSIGEQPCFLVKTLSIVWRNKAVSLLTNKKGIPHAVSRA